MNDAADLAELRARWRAFLDGAAAIDSESIARTATAAGARLFALAQEAMRAAAADGRPERGHAAHFAPLHEMRAEAAAAGLTAAGEAFTRAARGFTSIDWRRPGGATRRVLLSGFDPFARERAPAPEDWNPSGAAVLALAGTTLEAGGDLVAIEGVIYPVSYAQFDAGIVETVVAAHAGADAVLTVSMSPRTPGDAPMRVERFAVGVQDRCDLEPYPGRREPAACPGIEAIPPAGPLAVIDAGPDAIAVAAATGSTLGTDLHLRFPDGPPAGLSVEEGRHGHVLVDPAQVDAAVATMRFLGAPRVAFTIAGRSFEADLHAGPGGNFLSNASAYRTQRQLRALGSTATSFHVHTPGQTTTVRHVVTALERIVRAVVTRRRAAAGAPASSPQ